MLKKEQFLRLSRHILVICYGSTFKSPNKFVLKVYLIITMGNAGVRGNDLPRRMKKIKMIVKKVFKSKKKDANGKKM